MYFLCFCQFGMFEQFICYLKIANFCFSAPQKSFTDDTAMTKSVLRTLIVKNEINQEYLAKNFVKEFFTDPHRGYGEAVVEVFQKLRKSNCENPTSPAYEQFEGLFIFTILF